MAFIHIITHFTCLAMRTSIINNTHILFISSLHLSLNTAALVTFNDEEEGSLLLQLDFFSCFIFSGFFARQWSFTYYIHWIESFVSHLRAWDWVCSSECASASMVVRGCASLVFLFVSNSSPLCVKWSSTEKRVGGEIRSFALPRLFVKSWRIITSSHRDLTQTLTYL